MYMDAIHPDIFAVVGSFFGISALLAGVLLSVVAFWTIIWKGFGLWHAARDSQKWWFLAFLIINDLGILEIIYLLWVRKHQKNETPSLFEAPVVASTNAPVAESSEAGS
jgi:uncharacterized membrane protein HdeD (DUF308 family)